MIRPKGWLGKMAKEIIEKKEQRQGKK